MAKITYPKFYQHFKGGKYKVLMEGKYSETQEDVIIYQALYGDNSIWVRPKKMFFENVSRGDYNGPRFKEISEEEAMTMAYNREYTPEFITELKPNEIFVFGSNIHGFHGGGAAAVAFRKFGAEWGIGEGITGQCYALPTMEGGVDYVAGKVKYFIECAKQHPELKFFVTRVGCGIAGFKDSEIGRLFKDAIPMENVILPKEFVEEIEK